MTSFDAIVIGGGHNGLTAATLLARSGRKVMLIEADEALGGCRPQLRVSSGLRQSGPCPCHQSARPRGVVRARY
ncbi:FAD-dependent oxidoreductase [Ensifer canadensis]